MNILIASLIFLFVICIIYTVFLVIKCSMCKNGKCNMLGKCTCSKWWNGPKCDTLKCTGHFVPNKDKSSCVCDKNWTGEECMESTFCTTTPPCSGNGQCITNKYGTVCRCNTGYKGVDCGTKFKPSFEGCNTNPPCSGHGSCSDDGKYCVCDREWVGDQCQNEA